MSPWAKLDDRFHGHPKLLGVGLAGTGLFARGLAYCSGYSTDGFLPAEWVQGQLTTAEERKLPQRLVDAGLWQQVEGGYHVRDFLDYNPSRAQWEAERERKSKAGKKGANRRYGASDGTSHGKSIAEPQPEPEPEQHRPEDGAG